MNDPKEQNDAGINVGTDNTTGRPKSAVIYASRHAGNRRRLVYSSEQNGQIFIRVDVKDLDIIDALDRAHPEMGEMVVNTIPID